MDYCSAPSRLSFRVAAFARTRVSRVLANAATRKLRLDDSVGCKRGLLLRRLFHLNINRREVFVVAGGVLRFDAQHVESRFLNRKGAPRPDPAFGLKFSVNAPSVTVPF